MRRPHRRRHPPHYPDHFGPERELPRIDLWYVQGIGGTYIARIEPMPYGDALSMSRYMFPGPVTLVLYAEIPLGFREAAAAAELLTVERAVKAGWVRRTPVAPRWPRSAVQGLPAMGGQQ